MASLYHPANAFLSFIDGHASDDALRLFVTVRVGLSSPHRLTYPSALSFCQVKDFSSLQLQCESASRKARDKEDQLEAAEGKVQELERLLGIEPQPDAELSDRRRLIALKIRGLKKKCRVSERQCSMTAVDP